jgi:hypothetical protein
MQPLIRTPSLAFLGKLAEALNVSLAELVK